MTDYAYIRVSQADQANKGMSIPIQRARMIALGILEKNIYCDAGKTAGVKEDAVEYIFDGEYFMTKVHLKARQDLCKLMGILKEDDTVFFVKWDRISRNIHFGEVFVNWCVRHKVNLKPLDESTDRLTRRILTVVAEEEIYKTSSRNDSIFKGIFDLGGYPYRAPTGYVKNNKDENGRLKYPDQPESCLIIDPEKAKFVKELFHLMAQKVQTKVICEQYNINGQILYDVIRNRVYLGETHYGDLWKKSKLIPQIINEDIWKKANENIKKK